MLGKEVYILTVKHSNQSKFLQCMGKHYVLHVSVQPAYANQRGSSLFPQKFLREKCATQPKGQNNKTEILFCFKSQVIK